MNLDKDFEIRCQQIWAEVWIASLASHPQFTPSQRDVLASYCVDSFHKCFGGPAPKRVVSLAK